MTHNRRTLRTLRSCCVYSRVNFNDGKDIKTCKVKTALCCRCAQITTREEVSSVVKCVQRWQLWPMQKKHDSQRKIVHLLGAILLLLYQLITSKPVVHWWGCQRFNLGLWHHVDGSSGDILNPELLLTAPPWVYVWMTEHISPMVDLAIVGKCSNKLKDEYQEVQIRIWILKEVI